MKKICICGHFAFGKQFLDGQTVKTKVIAEELESQWGKNEIYKIDTHGYKNKILCFLKLLIALATCKNIIILPARNSLKLLAPWLAINNVFFKRRLHYLLIGSWLYDYLKEHKITAYALNFFYGIYPENTLIQKKLSDFGYKNVIVLQNCKKLRILHEEELILSHSIPLKVVTFSRVMKSKGIEDAVNIIKEINKENSQLIYKLDIYGPINNGEEEWFTNLKAKFSDNIKYMGVVDYDKTVSILSNYFVLLFPTQFPTEGVPGTIIDAYAAGLPIVSSKWNNYNDVIDDGVTGFGYEMYDIKQLKRILYDIYINPESIIKMKRDCIKKAQQFLPKNVIQVIKLK